MQPESEGIVTDHETSQAIEALASRIRTRDADPDRTDADVFALEFLTALRGQGWRPTAAKVIPAWKPGPRADGGLPQGEEAAELVRKAHADAEAARAAFLARHRGDGSAA
jgi:hypothetical protein